MSKVLAAEWDSREVRVVSGFVGNSVVVEHALSQALPPVADNASIDPSIISKSIRELASKAGFTSGDILVAVGRGQVELRNITPQVRCERSSRYGSFRRRQALCIGR